MQNATSNHSQPVLDHLRQQLRSEIARSQPSAAVISSGFALLDEALPHSGWSAGAIELLLDTPLCGVLSFLLPTLLGLQAKGRRVAFVNAPVIPYAPGLQAYGLDLSRLLVIRNQTTEDAAWACEQLLQSASCGVILAWIDPRKSQSIRRLQLQAKAQRSLLFLCRPLLALRQSSIAQARIQLSPTVSCLQLKFHKLQGEIRRPELSLPWTEMSGKEGASYGA